MPKPFDLIGSQYKTICDHIKKDFFGEDWLNYVAFVFENKPQHTRYAYFSHEKWGKEYADTLHEKDPIRSLCKKSKSRIILWDRIALNPQQKDFMRYRQEKCSIHQAITLNLSSHEDEFKLLTVGGRMSRLSLETYVQKEMRKILEASARYTHLLNTVTSSS